MKRRTALVTLASAASLAGCTARFEPANSDERSDDTATNRTDNDADTTWEGSLSSVDIETGASRDDHDDEAIATEPPIIHVDDEDKTLEAHGVMTYSSSNCRSYDLTRVDERPDDDELSLEVSDYLEDDAPDDCNVDETSSPYIVRAEFEGELPGTIIVIQDGNEGTLESTYP